MLKFLKALFGGGSRVDFSTIDLKNAIILDVRTPNEFQSGHISGAQNIPLQTLQQNLKRLKKDKQIITCCASGRRSGMAKSILESAGYVGVINGGGWTDLKDEIKKKTK